MMRRVSICTVFRARRLGQSRFLKAVFLEDSLHASGADLEAGLPELARDGAGIGLRVEEPVSNNLAHDLPGPAVVWLGATALIRKPPVAPCWRKAARSWKYRRRLNPNFSAVFSDPAPAHARWMSIASLRVILSPGASWRGPAGPMNLFETSSNSMAPPVSRAVRPGCFLNPA
jgi:hypothetical protein